MDIALNDFSGGELNSDAKRMNGALAQTGARVMSNWRILNTKKLKNRPGRRALFLETGRIEKVKMSPGNYFYLVFGNNTLRIYSSTGVQLLLRSQTGGGATIPWTTATLGQICYAIFQQSIYVTFSGMRPQVLTWGGGTSWSIADYTESVVASGQKRTWFYRISPQNVTMLPSAVTGNITLSFSSGIAVAGMVGTRMRFCERQVLITGYNSSTSLNAAVIEPLPPGMTIGLTAPSGTFALGDEVRGSVTNAVGIVTGSPSSQYLSVTPTAIQVGDTITGGTSGATGVVTANSGGSTPLLTVSLNTATAFVAAEAITGSPSGGTATVNSVSTTALTVQLLPTGTTLAFFSTSDKIVGPAGSATVQSASTTTPQAVSVWDDEVMNSFRGYPTSVFVDQFRVGFCNFPVLPNAIGWSGIDQPIDLYVDGTASAAMLELAPNKSQVLYVVPGAEGNEMVFCDNRIYYIPISASNPLKSGSVAFNQISGDGCYPMQPRLAGTTMLYLAAGGLRVSAIVTIGLATRPFDVANLTEFHTHLLNAPVAIAVPTADGTFSERYAYVLNGDGTIAVGKYSIDQYGQIQGSVGWLPWTGAGTVSWLSAFEQEVTFVTSYTPNGIAAVSLVEVLDDTLYLDAAMFANAIPAAFTPLGGKGPFWWIAGGSVTLMDQSYRPMGIYQIDANGNIIPQFDGGEDLTVATLVGGQAWNATYEPFLPQAPQGQDSKQRLRRRKVVQAAVSVQSSSGFTFDGKRVPAYFQDDDATKPPPLREDTFKFHPTGLDYDPRKQLIKDTPGPLIITEVGIEATV
jgi:hypothetical protein